MMRRAAGLSTALARQLLRGYAQLFLCGNAASGALIFAGLVIASPSAALWSLLGAATITATARLFPRAAPVARSGLLTVNGVLLGLGTAWLPGAPTWFKAAAAAGGSAALACAMIPMALWLSRRASRFCLLSLPSVAAVWLMLWAAAGLGFHDPQMVAGGAAVTKGDGPAARLHWEAASVSGDRAASLREDGLGWACFFEQRHAQAGTHFERAAALDPAAADPLDGLGWTALKSGQTGRAETLFRQAVARDPLLADSWDGLGWIAWGRADAAQARQCFARAAFCAPLFGDAWGGLAQSARATGHARGADLAETMAKIHAPAALRFTPITQWVCWALFLLAILVHSRLSALAVLGGAGVLAAAAWLGAPVGSALADANFGCNLAVIAVALAGQYFRPGWAGMLTLAGSALLMALAWPSSTNTLPLLWLPCNLVLLAHLAVRRDRVPLDVAATDPHSVRLWAKKKDVAQACWRMLER